MQSLKFLGMYTLDREYKRGEIRNSYAVLELELFDMNALLSFWSGRRRHLKTNQHWTRQRYVSSDTHFSNVKLCCIVVPQDPLFATS